MVYLHRITEQLRFCEMELELRQTFCFANTFLKTVTNDQKVMHRT